MKNQRYHLLTKLIVSALHPNEPQSAGTKWDPTNAIDIQEANELVQMTYAERIDGNKADTVTPTWLQRQDEGLRKVDADEADEAVVPLAGKIVADDQLDLILEGNVESVRAELDGLSSEQLHRLDELEGAEGGKRRKGVHDAITDAVAALDQLE